MDLPMPDNRDSQSDANSEIKERTITRHPGELILDHLSDEALCRLVLGEHEDI
jgi:hypothetical protein